MSGQGERERARAARQRAYARDNRKVARSLEAGGFRALGAVYARTAAEHEACARRIEAGRE